jgi:hypothetical protein
MEGLEVDCLWSISAGDCGGDSDVEIGDSEVQIAAIYTTRRDDQFDLS